MLSAWKRSRLPPEYQEVEWIGCPQQSTPIIIPYINTGISPAEDVEMIAVVRQLLTSNSTNIFGSRDTSKQANFFCNTNFENNRCVVYFYNYTYTTDGNRDLQSWMQVKYTSTGGQTIYIEDGGRTVNVNYRCTVYPAYPIYLFARNENGNQRGGQGLYMKSAKILKSGIRIRDFVPCVRQSDNEPGMYDLCGSICPLTNSPFYTNAGTGAFIVGPDVN